MVLDARRVTTEDSRKEIFGSEKRMAGKLRRASIGLACGAALLWSGNQARAVDIITFGHVGAPSAIVWPLYIGLDQGFFDERNIKLDITFTRSSAQVLQQLAAGSIDMGDTSAFDPV